MYYGGYGATDMSYFLLVVISLVLGLGTQAYINQTYKKWSRVPARSGYSALSGVNAARQMLYQEGITNVGIVSTSGRLTDHYDPRDNRLHLSQDNIHGGSVASVAVACHEAGHAVQNATSYMPMRFRSALVPAVNFATRAWFIMFFIGVALSLVGLVQLSLLLFAFAVLFQLVTLPVEFDASARALRYIETSGMDTQTLEGARQVLRAAALTYVAAALVSVLQLLYMLGRSNRRR